MVCRAGNASPRLPIRGTEKDWKKENAKALSAAPVLLAHVEALSQHLHTCTVDHVGRQGIFHAEVLTAWLNQLLPFSLPSIQTPTSQHRAAVKPLSTTPIWSCSLLFRNLIQSHCMLKAKGEPSLHFYFGFSFSHGNQCKTRWERGSPLL